MSEIRDHRKRLRDRFKKSSLENFHNYEVLELLLTFSLQKKDVKPVAKALLSRFKGLRGVFDATIEELSEVPGIGENASILIGLIKGVTTEYLKERVIGSDVIRCSNDVIRYLRLSLSCEKVERFIAIYLNSRNEAMAVETLHVGAVNTTVVYPRKAIELAFRHGARSVIFIHNHPGGDATPSAVDRNLIRVLDRAAIAVDLLVHDHMIVGRDKHFSARENGWVFGSPAYIPHAAET